MYSVSQAANAVINDIEAIGFTPTAVLTYRQEWLALRSHLAYLLNLPGPSREAIEIAGDKFKTKTFLKSLGFETPNFEAATHDELRERHQLDSYPCFIRPSVGIRSEWARALFNTADFRQYVTDVVSSNHFAARDIFLIESLLRGHEVDVDLFLYDGCAFYGMPSDNFPVRFPFALETGHLMPSVLPTEIRRNLVDVASQAALACGFQNGNVHAELMVLPDGRVFVLELNGRMGGMYIAEWHKRVWDVDLILAELAVALGQSPVEYLVPEYRGMSFAQLCVTAPPIPPGAPARTVHFPLARYTGTSSDDVIFESWYEGPEIEHPAMCGPLNLGALTVSGSSPEVAFARLAKIAHSTPICLDINGGSVRADVSVLSRFCLSSPVRRYSIRQFVKSDIPDLLRLLSILTSHATFTAESVATATIDPNTVIFCATDELRPEAGVVGTISIHFWRRLRPAPNVNAYVHDLVVLPEYRHLGIANQLFQTALGIIIDRKCYKADLDCDSILLDFYRRYGFEPVGDCMVRYFAQSSSAPSGAPS
jgi:ribosomal protein S18 acetylase RimI-like enzyme